jgi:hypothetical protein
MVKASVAAAVLLVGLLSGPVLADDVPAPTPSKEPSLESKGAYDELVRRQREKLLLLEEHLERFKRRQEKTDPRRLPPDPPKREQLMRLD